MFGVTYGYSIQLPSDPVVTVAEESVRIASEGVISNLFNAFPTSESSPGFFFSFLNRLILVRYIPFPGAGFKALAEEGRRITQILIQKPFMEATSRIVRLYTIPIGPKDSVSVIRSRSLGQLSDDLYPNSSEISRKSLQICIQVGHLLILFLTNFSGIS